MCSAFFLVLIDKAPQFVLKYFTTTKQNRLLFSPAGMGPGAVHTFSAFRGSLLVLERVALYAPRFFILQLVLERLRRKSAEAGIVLRPLAGCFGAEIKFEFVMFIWRCYYQQKGTAY